MLTILLFSNFAAAQRTAVHSLAGPKFPYGSLALDKAGHLYDTTEFGGDNNQGTVFKVTVDSNGNSSPAQSASASLSILIAPGLTATPGATATQYVLSYTAGKTNPCTIEVSTSPSYSPLVHAVDPTRFSGSNGDGQTNVGPRAFVVGQKWIAQEDVSRPSIIIARRAASRASGSKLVTVSYSNQPFVVGDNITIMGMSNSAYNDAWARVDVASGNSFSYEVLTTAGSGDTSGGGTVTRADRYSLALATDTTYYYRIGGASNTCGASPATGTFTTMDIPNGNTWAEGPIPDPSNPLNQMYPTFFDDRTTTYNDPLTGTVVKRLALYGDGGIGGGPTAYASYASGAAAEYRVCSPVLSNSGYHCWIGLGGSYSGGLYWINPSTGTVKFLGLMSANYYDSAGHYKIGSISSQGTMGDNTDPDRFYVITQTNSGNVPWKNVLGYVEYTGGDNEVATGQQGGVNWTVATGSNGGQVTELTPSPSNTLSDMMNSCALSNTPAGVCFQDPHFSAAHFSGCGIVEVVGNYIKIACHSFQQDSLAWEWVYNISAGQLVAGAPTYANVTTRWCGEHSSAPTLSTSWMNSGPKDNFDSTDGIEWDVKIISGAITSSTASFAVTGAVDQTIGQPEGKLSSGLLTGSDGKTWNYVQNVANGDYLMFEDGLGGGSGWPGEVIQVTSAPSCSGTACTYGSVTRGQWGTTPVAHAGGAVLSAACNFEQKDLNQLWWNYASDPTRSDTTETTVIGGGVNVYPLVHAGHGSIFSPNFTNDYDVSISSDSFTGDFSPSVISGLPNFTNQTALTFAGHLTDSPGVSNQNYFHWDFRNASFKSSQIMALFFLGGSGFGNGATNVTGKIWQFANGNEVTVSSTQPYFGMQGLTLLKDISGPGSVLPNTGSSEICIAQNAGECWSGSSVGDIYGDLPVVDFPTDNICRLAGENDPYAGHDFCILNPSMFGNAISQEGLVEGNFLGNDPRGVPKSDSANSRRLLQVMSGGWRQAAEYVHTLPDGSWFMFESCVGDPHINVDGSFDGGSVSDVYGCQEWMGQIPPQPPADGIDRTNYENVTVTIGAGSGGATHARVKYGYAENEPVRGTTWPPAINFYCTQYQGTCYSSDQNLALNSQQVLQVGAPQRVLFYQVEYLNGSNQVVASDPITAVAIP